MKKKWFYISAIVISLALIVTGVVFLFIVNYGVKKPDAVDIYTASNKTYIKATLNDNSSGYIFKFDDGTKNFTYESKNNLICADNLLNNGSISLGTTYKISVSYKNDYENGYSNFSEEKEWFASKFLEQPTIFVIKDYSDPDNIKDKSVYWEAVENADTYVLYYSCGSEIVEYQTKNTEVDLSILIGGEHNFYVVAKSDNKAYLDSPASKQVQATSYHKVKGFASATINRESKILSINAFDDVDEVIVYVGTSQNDAVEKTYPYIEGSDIFTKIKTNVGYQLLIRLNAIIPEPDAYIAVKPSVSGYNVYDGSVVVASIV